ncbi:hypothetical protein OJAV_G00122120 [Oryzias javanicus]|uniref:Uncharacterized protein n=1 Tax=Oryzias javanicus TaxID=123683 RepID=A0A3S2M1J8_ORYJA|nr:hypothetical protein OJAV_G00122120 [Oryzias javanicus]
MTFTEAGLPGACSLGVALGVPAGVGPHLIIPAARWLPTFGIFQPRVPTTSHLWISHYASPLDCLTATDSVPPAHCVLQQRNTARLPKPWTPSANPSAASPLLSSFSISLHNPCLHTNSRFITPL